MARYYGTISGTGNNLSTRTGTKSTGIEVSAQTFHGSVVVGVHALKDDTDMWELSIDESGSSRRGRLLFIGTLQELIEQLEK